MSEDICQRSGCKDKVDFIYESNGMHINVCKKHQVWGWCFVRGIINSEEVLLPYSQISEIGTLAQIEF